MVGATLVVTELRSSLNLIWKVPARSSERGLLKELLRMLHYRFWSFLMVLGAGFLLLASLVINTFVAGYGKDLQRWITLPPLVLQGVYWVFWFIVATGLFALILKSCRM